MALKNEFNQGGENPVYYNAEKIQVQGITEKVARDIAISVFHENITAFKNEAKELAEARAILLTEKIIEKKLAEGSDFERFREPRLQDDLFKAQKGYALSGNDHVLDILSEMISKASEANSEHLDLLFSEAIEVMDKLTKDHLDSLTFVFLSKRTVQPGLDDWSEFSEYYATHILPYANEKSLNDKTFKYLAFKNLCVLGIGGVKSVVFESHLTEAYPGLFMEGMTEEQLNAADTPENVINSFRLEKSDGLYYPSLYSDQMLSRDETLNEQEKQVIKNLWRVRRLNNDQILEKMSKINAEKVALIKANWTLDNELATLQISPVGMLIAILHHRKVMDLYQVKDIWI